MRQQINLYQPIFSDARQPLSSRIVALGFAALIAGLIGYSVYAQSNLSKLEAVVAELRAQQAEQEQLLATTGEEQATREKPVAVEARIKKLEQAIDERRVALRVLQSGAAGQTSGFAARMEALARRHVDGLWIDKLVLSGTNGSMHIEGGTLDADTVPVYLRSLAQEGALSGTRFDEFMIERPATQPSASQASSSEDGEQQAKPTRSAPAHIRFRAGNTTLTAAPSDSEATS